MFNIVHSFCGGLSVAAGMYGTFVGIAATAIGATGIGAPVGVALGVTAGIAGVVSVASGVAAAAGAC